MVLVVHNAVRDLLLGSECATTLRRRLRPSWSWFTSPWFGRPQGGCTKETRAFLHRLSGLVAVVEGCSPDTVRARLHDQLAVLLARVGGRAVRRRLGPPGGAVAKHAEGELLLEV